MSVAMTPGCRTVAQALYWADGSCNGALIGLSTAPGCGEVDQTPGRFTGRVIDPTVPGAENDAMASLRGRRTGTGMASTALLLCLEIWPETPIIPKTTFSQSRLSLR